MLQEVSYFQTLDYRNFPDAIVESLNLRYILYTMVILPLIERAPGVVSQLWMYFFFQVQEDDC